MCSLPSTLSHCTNWTHSSFLFRSTVVLFVKKFTLVHCFRAVYILIFGVFLYYFFVWFVHSMNSSALQFSDFSDFNFCLRESKSNIFFLKNFRLFWSCSWLYKNSIQLWSICRFLHCKRQQLFALAAITVN